MKNISPSSNELERYMNPYLVSEPTDFLRLVGESRLRALAKTIPSHGHHQLETITQGCISATIHATQEFLSQLVIGLSLSNPNTVSGLIVSSSGLDSISWLNCTKDDQHGWLPNCPVTGFITRGALSSPPEFGMSPLEPAVTLNIKRCDDKLDDKLDDFLVRFSVADAEDMRLLAKLMVDAGDLWDAYEHIFSVTPFTSIPLLEEVDISPNKRGGCRDYAAAFIEQIVDNADEEDCLETFDLEFAVKQNAPLHEPIVASVALLNAFSFYRYSVRNIDHDNYHAKAMKELKSAIKTGALARHIDYVEDQMESDYEQSQEDR